MPHTYDLSKLGSDAFENIVNFLALKTLGAGVTGFSPGADGGRDGYFEGEAPYPSQNERWKGVWYIQSKFHRPHLSKDPQKWLIAQVKEEIAAFNKEHSDRAWPDNWIIATNIDPSGKPETGSFDTIRKLVSKAVSGKKVNVHVWGGRKILDLLTIHSDAAKYYGHLLTPGHVISELYQSLTENRASTEEIIRYFVVTQFSDHTYTKLDQAGSSSDVRPGVHDLFIDLPFHAEPDLSNRALLSELCKSSSQCHRYSLRNEFPEKWNSWHRHIKRARVILIIGGPGQGKSTIGQYLCQIHRAFLILEKDGPRVIANIKSLAKKVAEAAQKDNFWPTSARIPILVELKEFAHWYSQRQPTDTRDVLSFIADKVAKRINGTVLPKTIKSVLAKKSWIVIFDGLDEVPNDRKEVIANEVLYFLNDILIEIDGDVLALCTSRPQGYSGQFSDLDGPTVRLTKLDPEAAIRCAKPLLQFERTQEESIKSIQILESAIRSPNVQELMTTPLQSHIMAIVIRDGGRPPERRWQLFNSFYLVMKKRESLKNFQNPRIAKLLQEGDRLLKSVHMRLGFVLHARAERSEGAQTMLSKDDFRALVRDVVAELVESEIEETVNDVMEATTERLVLVSTPESGQQVRFDIRQLQEFFAAEFIYSGVDTSELANRIETIGGDQHWREVMHFLLSALIENQRMADVAVAVQELRKLNEGSDADGSSLYSRRTAKSTYLASRLLSEGVLEQDRRDRQAIRPLIDPIGGVLDLAPLSTLGGLRPMNSRQWLIQVLLEKLSTVNPQEYLGNLFLLAWLLPDGHPSEKLVLEAFFRMPVRLREHIIQLWAPREYLYGFGRDNKNIKENKFGKWVINTAFNILNSDEWQLYRASTIRALLAICHNEHPQLLIICKDHHLSDETGNAIANCLLLGLDSPEKRPTTIDKKLDVGLLKLWPFSANWMNGRIPEEFKNVDANRCMDGVNGCFRLMILCVRFAQNHSGQVIGEIVSIIDKVDKERLEAIPDALMALLPLPGKLSAKPFDVEHLRTINTCGDWQCSQAPQNMDCQSPYSNVDLNNSTPTEKEWIQTSSALPRIAVNIAFNSFTSTSSIFPWGREGVKFVPELLMAFQNNPDETANHILKWGFLADKHPDTFKEIKLRVGALRYPTTDVWMIDRQVVPFKLDLPKDEPLLPFLAEACNSWLSARHRHSDNANQTLAELLVSYGLDQSLLREIAEASDKSSSARSGALALYWLTYADSSTPVQLDLVKEKQLYIDLVDIHNERWLTNALVKGVLRQTQEGNENAQALAKCLMERCTNGDGPIDEVIVLLTIWREQSSAPVHEKQVLEKWLGYNFQPPIYAK